MEHVGQSPPLRCRDDLRVHRHKLAALNDSGWGWRVSGETIYSELGEAGTGVTDSVTFAEVGLGNTLPKFSISTGVVRRSSYLYVAYTR